MLASQLEQLREYDTALLANLLGYIDKTPAHEWYMGRSIRSVTPELGPTVGVAITCEIDTSTPDHLTTGDNQGFWEQVEQMERMFVPKVWVVRCVGSRPDHECVLGDGMAKALFAAGCVGVVTDGGVRDVPGLINTTFAAYAAGTTIHHCALRIRRTDISVELGGIVVHPGEIIHAGAEGVIKIQASAVETLLNRAPQYRAFEHAAHQILRRRDLVAGEKRARVKSLLKEFGFA